MTFLLAKGPVDGAYLDVGTETVTDENGQVVGQFDSYQAFKSWGLGVDGVVIAERLLNLAPGSISRHVTLAAGAVWHNYQEMLMPDFLLPDGVSGSAEGNSQSLGYLLRVTPLGLILGTGASGAGLFRLQASVAYGASILNKTDDFISHGLSFDDPFPRQYISGWGLNGQLVLANGLKDRIRDSGLGLLADAIGPLLSYTRADQTIDPGYVWDEGAWHYEHDTSGLAEENNSGWELGLANIYFIRRGHVEDIYGGIDGDTKGGGWNIPVGRLGGLRKDWADVPQTTGLPTVHRESWTVWVDVLAVMEIL